MWLLLTLLLAAAVGAASDPPAASAARQGKEAYEWPNGSLPSAADRRTNEILANRASHIALELVSAALRALAAPLTVPSDAWRATVVDVAAGLLEEEGRLVALFEEPAMSFAIDRALQGVQCTVGEASLQDGDSGIGTMPRGSSVLSTHARTTGGRALHTPRGGRSTDLEARPMPYGERASFAADVSSGTWLRKTKSERARAVHHTTLSSKAQVEKTTYIGSFRPTEGGRDGRGRAEDGAALLEAFARDPRGGGGWDSLRGWQNGTDPCDGWTGVACTTIDGTSRVTSVDLQDVPELHFELTGAVMRLNQMVEFGMGGTGMRGTIPRELSQLSRLQRLYMYNNPFLSGSIPSELGQLSRLQILALHSDPWLSGTIPSELGKLSQLRLVGIYTNPLLSGTIPSELCDLSQLERLDLIGDPSLSGTIPSELGELSQLQHVAMDNNPAISGTIPSELGELSQLERLDLYNNPSLSGTVPNKLGELSHLQQLFLSRNPSISGSIPSEIGKLSQVQVLDLAFIPLLSGSITSQVGELSQLQLLSLASNPSLSGSIPSELSKLSQLQMLELQSNPSLSGTILSELGHLSQLQVLYLASNPSLSGSIPSELGELSQLRHLELHSNPSVSGTIPSLGACSALRVLDVHDCSLTQLPASLPSSITHLYIDNNPIDAHTADFSRFMSSLLHLRVLNAGFINSHVQLTQKNSTSVGFGPRLFNPSPCHLGAPCVFVLYLYDDDDMPATSGGLLQNLTFGIGDKSAAMHDNRDGTFNASIPTNWINHTGSYTFRFEHNRVEFQPMMIAFSSAAVGPDCIFSPSTATYGGPCRALRTIKFLPRDCPSGNHTQPDAETGATCICRDGYIPDGNSTHTSRSCHRSCHGWGEGVGDDGSSCVCTGDTYNISTHGILLCSTDGWSAALDSSSYREAQAAQSQGDHCVSCPSECIRCERGQPTVREGWRLNATTPSALQSLVEHAAGEPQFVFSCPYSASDCPEMPLSSNHVVEVSSCPGNHTGPLCAACMEGYSRRGSSDNFCALCDASDYVREAYGLPLGWLIALVCAIVALVGVAAYALYPVAKQLKAETKTNLRILLGSAQVVSLLPTVLEIVFPPPPRAALSLTSLLAADLARVLRFECWGLSWYGKWVMSVIGVPSLGVSAVGVYWLWQWKNLRRMDADSDSYTTARAEAIQSTQKALAFVAMLLYPAVSTSIFNALRCRQLGEASSWLEADYTVSCLDRRYSFYAAAAYVLVVVVPIGFPLILLGALVRQWRRSCELWERAGSTAEGQGDEDIEAAGIAATLEDYHYSRVQELFGFAVDNYRPGCWWFEPADLFRKLALSGLLQFVHRGTAAQCFMGSLVAFASFGVQQYVLPYREPESNVLKALVDTQLFLTFLISFIVRVLPELRSEEPRRGCLWLADGPVDGVARMRSCSSDGAAGTAPPQLQEAAARGGRWAERRESCRAGAGAWCETPAAAEPRPRRSRRAYMSWSMAVRYVRVA